MSKKAPLIDKTAMTLAEMHSKHLRMLDLVESNRQAASVDLVQQAYKSAATGLKKDLACGDVDAAPLIAYLQGNGLGCEKNPLKAAIWVEIGANLGNRDCQNLKTDINPDHYSDARLHSLCLALREHGTSTERIFSPGVVSSGASYARAIQENIAKYNTTTVVLQSRPVIECVKHFEDSKKLALEKNNEILYLQYISDSQNLTDNQV